MKLIRSFVLTVLLTALAVPCRSKTDDSFYERHKLAVTSTAVAFGMLTVGLVAGSLLGYYKAKNRPFAGKPEPLKITRFCKTSNPRARAIFAHGLGDSPQSVSTLAKNGKLFNQREHDIAFFNFADVSGDINEDNPYPGIPNPEYTYLAQGNEIKRLSTVINRVQDSRPTIGIGHSRGAGTWITTLGTTQQSVDALILFAPFANGNDQIEYYVKNILGIFGKAIYALPFSNSWFCKTARLIFRKYNPKGAQPITCAPNIPINIPILFVHSKHDKIIPINESRKLYCSLRESGHDRVYLAEIDDQPIASPIENHMEITIQEKSHRVVHAFYKKLDLPYNQELAGDINMTDYQPDAQEVRDRINQK